MLPDEQAVSGANPSAPGFASGGAVGGNSQTSSSQISSVPQQATVFSRRAGMLTSTLHKGQYGEWLVGTIVAAAGYTVNKPSDFGDGIDLQVTWTTDDDAIFRADNVELQVKTKANPDCTTSHVKVRLKRKHYNALRTVGHTRRYLVVVIVPKDYDEWHAPHSDHHRFAQAVLWADLRGRPKAPKGSITVSVPLANIYTPATVDAQMQHARQVTMASLQPIVVEAP